MAGVALVGDAGHGVTPNLGQGCNAALETAAILGRVGFVLFLNTMDPAALTPSCAGHGAAANSMIRVPESIEGAR